MGGNHHPSLSQSTSSVYRKFLLSFWQLMFIPFCIISIPDLSSEQQHPLLLQKERSLVSVSQTFFWRKMMIRQSRDDENDLVCIREVEWRELWWQSEKRKNRERRNSNLLAPNDLIQVQDLNVRTFEGTALFLRIKWLSFFILVRDQENVCDSLFGNQSFVSPAYLSFSLQSLVSLWFPFSSSLVMIPVKVTGVKRLTSQRQTCATQILILKRGE